MVFSMPAAKNPEECLTNIKQKIAQKTGIANYLDLGKTSAAFSGTADDYDLYISLDVIQKRGNAYLRAYSEDYFEWYEYRYASQAEFEDQIVQYFCQYIGRTVKTITETKRHKYIRITEYYLDADTNTWVLFSDKKVSNLLLRPFIEDTSVHEIIKEYALCQ